MPAKKPKRAKASNSARKEIEDYGNLQGQLRDVRVLLGHYLRGEIPLLGELVTPPSPELNIAGPKAAATLARLEMAISGKVGDARLPHKITWELATWGQRIKDLQRAWGEYPGAHHFPRAAPYHHEGIEAGWYLVEIASEGASAEDLTEKLVEMEETLGQWTPQSQENPLDTMLGIPMFFAILHHLISIRCAPELHSHAWSDDAKLSATETARLERGAQAWLLEWKGKTVALQNVTGLSYIRFLILHEGQSFAAYDIDMSGYVQFAHAKADFSPTFSPLFETVMGDPLIGDDGLKDIQERRRQLEEDIEDAAARGDGGARLEAQEELDLLETEAAKSFSLGNRQRKLKNPSEEARQRVGKLIKSAIVLVGSVCPEAAAFLHDGIGEVYATKLCYRPTRRVLWFT